MFNDSKFIIKEEIFRHLLAEEFSLLHEAAPTTHPEIISWFHGLDRGKKKRIVREVNGIFLYNLSKVNDLQRYIMKNYLPDENLCLNLFLYVSGKYSLMDDLKVYVAKMYGNFLVQFYLNPKGLFGRKPIITGNKELDQIVLEILHTQFLEEIQSTTIKDLPTEFEGIMSDLETEIDTILTTNEKPIKDRLDEAFLDPHNVEKLLDSVQHIFYLNNATIKTMRAILKGMNIADMIKITAVGRSNTSNILSLGVMRRSAELLYQIKLKDAILDKMLGLLAYRLMSQSSIYHAKLKPALANFIYKKMNQGKQPKNISSRLSAQVAQYAGQ